MSTKHSFIKDQAKELLEHIKKDPQYKNFEPEDWDYYLCKKILSPLFHQETTKRIKNRITGLVYSKLIQKTDTIFQKYLEKLKKKKRKTF